MLTSNIILLVLTFSAGCAKALQRGSLRMHFEVKMPEENRIFGVPAWLIAVMVCLGASGLTVVGLVLQKKGSQAEGNHWRLGHIVLSPDWVLGFLCVVCASVPMDLLAYSLAPMGLTAPLSGVTVALNMMLAPRLLGERLETWPDAPASVLIMLGTVFTTASGPREEPIYTPDKLWTLLGDRYFLIFFITIAALVVFSAVTMCRLGDALKVSSRRPEGARLSMLEVLLPTTIAGGSGALTNISLKAVGVLMRAGEPAVSYLPWAVLTAVPALLQLNYMSKGLQLYPQTVFIPIYTAILVLLSTVGGIIFYQEYVQLPTHPQGRQTFTLGVGTIAAGIALFSYRPPDLTSSTSIVDGETTTGCKEGGLCVRTGSAH